MKVRYRDVYLFVAIFVLTLSHCLAYVGTPIESVLEYSGYLLLLSSILLSYFMSRVKYRRKNTSLTVVVLFILLFTGILVQDLGIVRKLTLLFTVSAIIIVSIMSEKYITRISQFRTMAYACLAGTIVTTLLCVIHGAPLLKLASEPTLGYIYFFTGGIRDKNIATMMIAIIISLYAYSIEKGHYKRIDLIVTGLCSVIILAANSRGAWIELFFFIFMLNFRKIKRFAKKHRTIIILSLLIVIIPLILYGYNNIVMKSETYLYRYRGLTNYLSMYGSDSFHLIFGNAEMAYGSSVDYATAVRSTTGWDGTIEIAWLNILIKNGLLGILAYGIIFIRAAVTIVKCNIIRYKTIYMAITVTLFVTSFVAIYIQTIHGLFGIYCYLLMAYYSTLIRKNRYFKGGKGVLLPV